MLSPSDFLSLPFSDWVNSLVRDWLVPNFRPFFRAMQWPVTQVLNGLSGLLNATPMLVFTFALTLIAWRVAGRGVALFTLIALAFIDVIGLWPETMTTLAMVVTAVLFCVADRHSARHARRRQRHLPRHPASDPRHHADDPILRVSGADRHAVRRRRRSRHHRHNHLRIAAHHQADRSRHPERARGSDRGRHRLWGDAMADAGRGAVPAGTPHGDGGPQPDADARTFDGRDHRA